MGTGLLVFLLGLSVGSFLNVCIERLPKGESVISPPSHCAACGHRLGLLDLIPVLSYFYLKGRCRYCQTSFSLQYPMVEMITGLLFAGAWARFGYSWNVLLAWVLVSCLTVITVADLKHMVIPDEVIIFALVTGGILLYLDSWARLKWGLASGLGAANFLALVILVSRGGMGWGDVKLAGVLGLFLGVGGTLVGLFVAFVAGALVGLSLVVAGRKGAKDLIPFGPFLSLGGLVAFFWGQEIVDWYLKLLVP
ncbi:prepilin peptidase [Syntrophothermus lipocalidus]|uniref:Prepilin peptidase n=1 Tax=Syntrophothermus lipocalidus (strain DSM 12680 / TGB-C1) TaxID=643648 RepID=D7CMM5_SYNLT|nr:Prepilin peptidase [Syntrophothermus lipocalidus DSM 12680]